MDSQPLYQPAPQCPIATPHQLSLLKNVSVSLSSDIRESLLHLKPSSDSIKFCPLMTRASQLSKNTSTFAQKLMLSMLPHQFVEEGNLSTSHDQQDMLKHRLSAILRRRLERPPPRSLKPKAYQTVQHHLVTLNEDIRILRTQIHLREAESTQRSQLFHGDNAVKSDPSLTLPLPKPFPSKPTTSSTSRWLKTISSHSSTVQNFQTAYGLMSSQTTSLTSTKSMLAITPSSLITNLQKPSEMLTSLSLLGEEQANH